MDSSGYDGAVGVGEERSFLKTWVRGTVHRKNILAFSEKGHPDMGNY